jgi:hypothetical protein
MYTYVCIHICMYTYVCIHICMYTYVHICMHTYMHVNKCTHMHTYMHVGRSKRAKTPFLIFLWPMPLLLLSTHKQCILSHFYTTALRCFPKNLIPWRGLNPGLLVPEVDAMSIAPCRQGTF